MGFSDVGQFKTSTPNPKRYFEFCHAMVGMYGKDSTYSITSELSISCENRWMEYLTWLRHFPLVLCIRTLDYSDPPFVYVYTTD